MHNKLRQYIPPTLPGTKKYWAKEYLDLAAFCERCGVPDFFVTLTANDNWPELKKFLNGVAPHFQPVETTVLFMQLFRALKPLLWGNKSVFGHVTDHWQRIEFQNRGALHIHMLLWVDNSESKEGKVSAVVERWIRDPICMFFHMDHFVGLMYTTESINNKFQSPTVGGIVKINACI